MPVFLAFSMVCCRVLTVCPAMATHKGEEGRTKAFCMSMTSRILAEGLMGAVFMGMILFPFLSILAETGNRTNDHYRSMTGVPMVSRDRPRAAFFESFSPKTILEKAMVTRMLSLSMGTTILAGPSCRAR